MRKIALLMFGLVAMTMIVPSIYPVTAIQFDATAWTSSNGTTWYVLTSSSFKPTDVVVSSIIAHYTIDGTPYPPMPTPKKVTLIDGKDLIKLQFSNSDVPTSGTGQIRVIITGTLTSGDTFFAEGPGWLWRKGG